MFKESRRAPTAPQSLEERPLPLATPPDFTQSRTAAKASASLATPRPRPARRLGYGEWPSPNGYPGYFEGGLGLYVAGGGGNTVLTISPGKYYGVNTASAAQFDIPGTGNVLFWDNVHVNNTFTAGIKNFEIDHPLDPANWTLRHSCVESDAYRNLYDGEVRTDSKGHAVVRLPSWFEALNGDLRYQLTVVDEDGDDFIQAKVSRRLRGGSFAIRTSKPDTVVCWQVTGVRKDAYALANPLRVEEAKPPALKGRLLHPRARAERP